MHASPTYRRAGGLLLAALATLIISACGEDQDASSTRSTTATAASSNAFPATIEHRFGTTTIDAAPQRVVAVGFNDQDFALALGVKPVGARQFQAGIDIADRPWAQAALDGAQPELIGAEELNFEQIAALHPDVILGIYSGMTQKDYELLSAIAPTVAQSGDYVDYGMPWEEQTRSIGRALGREAQAQQLVTDVQARFAQARERLDAAGRTYAFAAGSPEGVYLYDDEDLRSRFFASLGFELPDRIAKLTGDQFYAQISNEELRLLDQDLLVIYGDEAQLRRVPGFTALQAVRDGRVIYLKTDGDLANALGFSSPLSLPYAIDAFVPRIEAALE